MYRTSQKLQKRRPRWPDSPAFIRKQNTGRSVVTVNVTISVLRNAPANLPNDWQRFGMISRKLQFHGVTIKDLAFREDRKSAADAHKITSYYEVKVGVMGFYLALFLLVEG